MGLYEIVLDGKAGAGRGWTYIKIGLGLKAAKTVLADRQKPYIRLEGRNDVL